MPYVPRALAATIRRAMRTFPAVLVIGPRQTGKTTLLREEFGASHRYVSLERPDVRDVARDDPVGFLADAGDRVILDEIQYQPQLLHYVKDDIDARRQPGRWLLTGSQDLALMRGVSQTLAGRTAVLHLDPLAVPEIVGAPAATSLGKLLDSLCADPGGRTPQVDLADWLHRGAWPEPRLDPDVDRDLWMQSYVQTYLERDLRNMEQVGDLETFRAFFSLVCASTGQVLNLARLGRDAGVSAPTARRWLNLLVTSRLVVLLPPYHRNFGKRIRKSPKLHVIDPGLASWMSRLPDHRRHHERTRARRPDGVSRRVGADQGHPPRRRRGAPLPLGGPVRRGRHRGRRRRPALRHRGQGDPDPDPPARRPPRRLVRAHRRPRPPRLPDRPRPPPPPRHPGRAVALLRVRTD